MKVMMTGVGGMLGDAFAHVFADNSHELSCSDLVARDVWLDKLDFRDFDSYMSAAKRFRPDILFHIGAHTSLEFCEVNVSDAYYTNTLSVENAVTVSNTLDIPLLYISTAGIFDGRKELYDDWDTPNPLGVYARSKYLGEVYVQSNARRYFICRAGWMMGGGPAKDKKFVSRIMGQLKAGRRELFVVDDKDGTPTYTYDFATCCHQLVQTEFYGVYNMVCGGLTSRLEVTEEILKVIGKDKEVVVTPVSSDHFQGEFFASRPSNERLVNTKLQLRGLDSMRDWKVCLREYLDSAYCNYL